MKYAVGIDIGGTNTRVAFIDDTYTIIKRIEFETEPNKPMLTLQKIQETIQVFDSNIEGIGVSCPGPLDLVQGKVLTPPNLPGWHGLEIEKELHTLCGVHVKLENDANLACLGEAVLGAGKDAHVVQFLTISTGIGTGLTVEKQLFHGARGFAQEIANCIYWKDGPQLGDLKKGSIESISSGSAITKRAKDAGLIVKHAGEVNDLAKAGNDIAIQIMEDAKDYLANLMATFYAVIDPDIFILSGSVALKIDGFCEEMEVRVKEKVYETLKDNIMVRKAKLGEDCGLIGAAYLVMKS